MFANFRPTWMIESVYDLTPAQIKKHKIKVVLTDLDNTLIAWNNPNGTPQLKKWLAVMKENDIPVVVVSNNSYKRVKRAVAKLELPFISRALKPFGRGVNLAKKKYNLKDDEVVLIGDQLMTDIAAANSGNIKSILVKPLVPSDAWNTKINRFFESIVKRHLLKTGQMKKTWGHSLDD